MHDVFNNIMLLTDGYKPSHWKQLPPGTKFLYSYFESRGGQFPYTIPVGLQYVLERYLAGCVVTPEKIRQADALLADYFGDKTIFNRAGWEYLVREHRGHLPLRIKSVPEGMHVPVRNVLMTVENTDPKVPWLTNYVEPLLVQLWYPMTVATKSHAIRRLILSELELTGDPALIDYKLHDFGFRGVSSVESGAIGGHAHLANFNGSDTLVALLMAGHYYGGANVANSIPAAEHSTITSWGEAHEIDAYRNMLKQFPKGYVAVVSDSYNIFKACRLWSGPLRDRVLERDGVLVIRPDSGPPPETVREVLRSLGDGFGYTENAKGYRVLEPHVRVIQGDGIDYQPIADILKLARLDGWSADNITFGMGGALLQKVDRDTQEVALKCSWVRGDFGDREVYKAPVGDPMKVSKKGRLKLVATLDGGVGTANAREHGGADLLGDVFVDGSITRRTTTTEIRQRARAARPQLVA